MIRLFVIVEGGTEQEFVKQSLAPHLSAAGVWTTPIEVTTKTDRKTGQKVAKGGGHWKHWRRDICTILRSNATDLRVTSLFDLYGIPDDFPGLAACAMERDTVRRTSMLEAAMGADIHDRRFIPYIQRHEFESLVLSGLEYLREQLVDSDARAGVDVLQQELGAVTPEDVNDGMETAPSKRLLARVPGYGKKLHGPLVTGKVGIDPSTVLSLETGCAAYVFGCGGQGACCIVDPHEADVGDYIAFRGGQAHADRVRVRDPRPRRSSMADILRFNQGRS